MMRICAVFMATMFYWLLASGQVFAVGLLSGGSSGGGGGLSVGSSRAVPGAHVSNFNVWGRYTESAIDMNIKVLGGELKAQRTWADGRWQINRAWNPIAYNLSTANKLNSTITRNGKIYRTTNGTLFTHLKRKTIQKNAKGYRWQDREGNWIDYDTQGNITKYGDRNNVVVSILRDANGKISGASDHRATQLIWYTYDVNGNIASIRDYAGRTVQYIYDANHRMSEVVDVRGNHWFYTYNVNGLLATKKDPLNRTVTFTYSAEDRLLIKKDQDGVGFSYEYNYDAVRKEFYEARTSSTGVVYEDTKNEQGRFTGRKVGGVSVFTLADSGRTKVRTDSAGNNITESYDEWNNLVRAQYADGTTSSTTYGTKYSRPLTITNENGVVTKFAYDPYGNMQNRIEAFGKPEARTTTYTFDALGQQLTATRGLSTYSYTYDPYGNVATVKDPLNNVSSYTHDVMGNVLLAKNALNQSSTYTYDVTGNPLSEKDPLNNSYTYTYDGMNNRLTNTDAKNQITTYAYDIRSKLVGITDSAGKQMIFTYNGDGQVTREVDRAGKVQSYKHSADGRLASVDDGTGSIVTQTFAATESYFNASVEHYPGFDYQHKYDKRGRVISNVVVATGKSRSTNMAYDGVGNITAITDANGVKRTLIYDALSRVKEHRSGKGYANKYTYDKQGNLTSFSDGNGNVTRFEYDLNGRLIKQVRPMGQFTSFEYDAVGNLTAIVNARNQRRTFTYDVANRVTSETLPASNGQPAATIQYTYDTRDNLVAWSDGNISATHTYDNLGRLLIESVNYGTFTKSFTYTYEANGAKKSFTGPDQVILAYSYDSADRLQAIVLPGQGSFAANGFRWNSPTKVTLPGGASHEYSYDAVYNIQSQTARDPAKNPYLSVTYAYDNVDRLRSKIGTGGNRIYTYDTDSRLTEDTGSKYTLDAVANRLHVGAQPSSDPASLWSYNANNELTARPSVSYQYDADGNQTSKTENGVTTQYLYDASNRLVQIKQGGNVTASYAYDPFDRRVWKEVAGKRTSYLYADEGLVAEFDAAGVEAVSYGWLPDSTWGTQPLFQKRGANYYFYHYDHQGTPQQLTSRSGAVVWQAAYDSFGQATVDVLATVANSLRAGGQYYDEESGLHYNWRRYYEPSTGRYITIDPIGLSGGQNLYAYVNHDPINALDPTGECALVGAAIGAVTGGFIDGAIALASGACWTNTKKAALEGAAIGAVAGATCGIGFIAKGAKWGWGLAKGLGKKNPRCLETVWEE